MTLTHYRRHKRTCCNFGKRRGEKQRQCKCKFWVNGVLGGREVRLSLDTRDIKKASQKLHEWEAKERVVERDSAVTLADAWVSYLADLEARKLSYQTIRKYKLLQRHMKAYGEERGLTLLGQFDLDVLSRFRATWKDGPRTAGKKLERLRAFFRFSHERQWVESNPATRIKLPKVSIRPTMPLTPEEMVKILTACDGLQHTTPIEGRLNAHRLKTLVLLMRYTGMRVSDAVTLTTDRLDGKRLFF
jgi:site-specific recombinase XerD